MNWRSILGLILLILGVRVFYVAMTGTGTQATYIKIAGFVWIAVGTFLILRSIMKKTE